MSIKNQLQEYCQKNKLQMPIYDTESRGPPHNKEFLGSVNIAGDLIKCKIWMKSKKEAEVQAASDALDKILNQQQSNKNQNINELKIKPEIKNEVNLLSFTGANSLSYYIQLIQEYAQKNKLSSPQYTIENDPSSESHAPRFFGSLNMPITNEIIKKFSINLPNYFNDKKLVKQHLAKAAYEYIENFSSNQKEDRSSILNTNIIKFDDTDTIPSTKTKPRKYQEELYMESMKRNVICYLPTGAGKTLVSSLVIKRMKELNPKKRIVFVVDRIPLVTQQSEVISNETGLKVIGFCGDTFDEKKLTQQIDVIVIIAALFINLLNNNTISIKEFSLVVIDEAHHITKEHPFAVLVRSYINQIMSYELKPKLLCLTASPIGGEDIIDTIARIRTLIKLTEANLIMPKKYEEELNQYINPQSLELITLSMNNDEVFMKNIIDILNSQILADSNHIHESEIFQDEIILYLNDNLTTNKNNISLSDLIYLINDLYKQLQLLGYIYYKNNIITDISGFVYSIIKGSNISDTLKEKLINKNNISLTLDDSNENSHINTNKSKFIVLLELLNKLSQDPAFKAIIFIETRENATLLHDYISTKIINNNNRIRPTLVTGQGKTNEYGMSIKKQLKAIKDFRSDTANVLIATSVIEEGFDVPTCNTVIRLDLPSSVTALIQSRGRLRYKDNKFIAIVKSDQISNYNKLLSQENNIKNVVNCLYDNKLISKNLIKDCLINQSNKTSIQILEEYCQLFRSYDLNFTLEWDDVSTNKTPLSDFSFNVKLNKYLIGSGSGNTKQKAKETAAYDALFNRNAFIHLIFKY